MRGFDAFKKDKKYFISLILLFLFIISVLSNITFASSESDSPSMDLNLYLKEDGTLHIKKVIHYPFTGQNDNYREIYLENNQKPENLKVSFQGAYGDYDIIDNWEGTSVKIYFYSNPEKTVPIGNKNVDVFFEYDLIHLIKIYNNNAVLSYDLLNDSKHEAYEKLTANLYFKSNKSVYYWLDPSYYSYTSGWNQSDLKITVFNNSPYDYLKINVLIPKNQFNINPKNGIVINKNFTGEIDQIDDQDPQVFPNNFYGLLSGLILLLSFTPLFIYFIYGREPKIDYGTKYETDLPTDDPPAIVNAVCAGDPKRIGVPNLDGFRATIMDLIDRNYLLLNNAQYGEDYDTSGSLFLEINSDYDPDTLWDFENTVIDFLREYEQDGIISMNLITESLGYYNSSRFFKYTYKTWQNEVKKAITDGNFKKAFHSKGDKYLKTFGLLGVGSVLVFFRSASKSVSGTFILCMLILGGVSLVSLLMPQRIAGRWTNYGREYYEKWHSFKRYIKDYSLIKEYPPESVNVWNKYLVYATALGAADGVRQAIGLYFPQDQGRSNDQVLFSSLENILDSVFNSD